MGHDQLKNCSTYHLVSLLDEKQRSTFDIFVPFLIPLDTLTNSGMVGGQLGSIWDIIKNYNREHGKRQPTTVLHKNMSRHLSTQLCLCKTRHFCVQLTLIRFGQQTMHWADWEHREKSCHRKTMIYHMVILVITMMMIMNNQSVRCEINRSFPSPAPRENLQVYNSSRQQWSLLWLSWN